MDQLTIEASFGTVTLRSNLSDLLLSNEDKVQNFVGIWFYDDNIDPEEISQMENRLNEIFDYSKMFPTQQISRLTECLTRIAVKREEFLTIYIYCLTNINDYQIYC
ncbi:unnamed protein product [Didymodactylos carnosus]|uniref:Uncharacterized protein n=1 Tax=Didymodactylos carnosus TaxID=1234261 RepID=A0A816F1L4_9BILA|nr:unnamed protein product [Didymodactylos carnosus]CAF1655286.1 unnamed protein product [Didymodactylos carnosus]CAF4140841.1 unnamed protein product [Didymodactylos carnosus]CAF4591618.1 unnamed protein product [Didymodactylos carnosus]